jgi:hypothetical protein
LTRNDASIVLNESRSLWYVLLENGAVEDTEFREWAVRIINALAQPPDWVTVAYATSNHHGLLSELRSNGVEFPKGLDLLSLRLGSLAIAYQRNASSLDKLVENVLERCDSHDVDSVESAAVWPLKRFIEKAPRSIVRRFIVKVRMRRFLKPHRSYAEAKLQAITNVATKETLA